MGAFLEGLPAGTVVRLLISLMVLSMAVGCTDVCEEAICQLRETCELEVERDEDASCSGEQEQLSQCIVDHTAAACDYFDDPVAHAGNDYALCIE